MQVGYLCTRTQIKQPTNGLASSDKSMAKDEPPGGNGSGSEDRLLVGLADEGVACLEEGFIDLSDRVSQSINEFKTIA